MIGAASSLDADAVEAAKATPTPDDALGLLNFFNEAPQDPINGRPCTAGADKEDIVREQMDEFRRDAARRRWEHARTLMDKRSTATVIEPPQPLYRKLSLPARTRIEVAQSGAEDRPETLPARCLDATLGPPVEHEPLGPIPKWIRYAPDAMAPANRPYVVRSTRVYTYGVDDDDDTTARCADDLRFTACFESGNLLSATRLFRSCPIDEAHATVDVPLVVDHEYDLQMHPDLKTVGNTQWYFFEVSNVESGTLYRFNVTNFAKSDSLYLEGMQPLLYSSKGAANGVGWRRAGSVICYSRNPPDVDRQQVADWYAAVGKDESDVDDSESSASGSASDGSDDEQTSPVVPAHRQQGHAGGTHTMSFDIEFEHDDDVVYMAYSHPYTYTDLQKYLAELASNPKTQHTCTRKTLCKTIAGNCCDLLTITAPPYVKPRLDGEDQGNEHEELTIHTRRLLVVSARVHPGESNSSWIMHGILDFLTSHHPAAVVLRKHFVFKIVPMLNPDGVINGNYRCSLSGQDLNRQWHMPCRNVHPTIAAFKHLMQAYQSRDESRIALFCDLHGHSRAQGLFLYGILSNADKQQRGRRSKPPTTFKLAVELAVKNSKDFEKTEDVPQSSQALDDTRCGETGDESDPTAQSSQARTKPKKTFPAGDPRLFPIMLAKRTNGIFTKKKTSFKLGRGKSCTARAVTCRELGVRRSYTLEVSFCGGVGGVYQESQFATKDLMHMGRQWCLALVDFFGLNEEVVTMVKLSKIASTGSLKVPPSDATTTTSAALGDTVKASARVDACSTEPTGSGAIGHTPLKSAPEASKVKARHRTGTSSGKRPQRPRTSLGVPSRQGTVEHDITDDGQLVPPGNQVEHHRLEASGTVTQLSKEMRANGLDIKAFSAMARQAEQVRCCDCGRISRSLQLLKDTAGLTLDSPDLWDAVHDIHQDSDAEDGGPKSASARAPSTRSRSIPSDSTTKKQKAVHSSNRSQSSSADKGAALRHFGTRRQSSHGRHRASSARPSHAEASRGHDAAGWKTTKQVSKELPRLAGDTPDSRYDVGGSGCDASPEETRPVEHAPSRPPTCVSRRCSPRHSRQRGHAEASDCADTPPPDFVKYVA